MRKKEENGHIEVKAVVTEVLDEKSDVIYDGGLRRDYERQEWLERREMFDSLTKNRGGRPVLRYRDEMDDILPRRDYYVERTTKVRARYSVNGQAYEGETVLRDVCGEGKKIYLTIDPSRPEEPLKASLYKSWGPGDDLMLWGMPALMAIFSAAMLFLLYRYQIV